MEIRHWLVLLLALPLTTQAQTEDHDSLTMDIGYAKGDITTIAGAIDQVTEKEMNKGLITNSLEALSGQAAGVQVAPSDNQEAMVSAVRVRGTTSLTGKNDPLVIIDGVTADLTILSTIYPADIEKFTILKDASETAQYGSRGAAGVIEVTTKKGRNQKFSIIYDGSVGFESIYKRMEMLDGNEFRQLAKEMEVEILDMGANTNWNKTIERTGFVHKHHIAFGGGTETANYRASVGMIEHNTVIKTKENQNYIAKLDIRQVAFDNHLTVDLGVVGSLQKLSYLADQQKLIYSAATFNPTIPEGTTADGGYYQIPEATAIRNPLAMLNMKQSENNNHINFHLKATVTITKNLILRAFTSYSYTTVANQHYYPTYIKNDGEAYRFSSKDERNLYNASLNYKLNTKRSDLNVMALVEYEERKKAGFNVTTTGFSSDAFGLEKISAGVNRPWDGTDSYFTDSHMESILARVQYTLDKKYTLTANARADASSKFGKNHRWGFFPSISGAWVISRESWMQPIKHIVSRAKLRVGYGLSGSQAGIDSYNSMEVVQPNGVVPVNGSIATTLGIIRNANPDLKWEVKRSFNIGLDLGLWQNRIAMTIDYYRSKTTDMLYVYDVPVPPFTYSKLLANLGSMENSGLEIGFGITPLRTRDMEFTINMNWSFPRNKLISLDGDYNGQYLTTPGQKTISYMTGAGFHANTSIVRQIVGQPLGVFKLPHCKGIIEVEGVKTYDVTDETYVCGQAMPKATMGSNFAFRYKDWDITLQMNGAFGHKIFNGTALSYMNIHSLPNYNVMKGAEKEKIETDFISDYWLENGDYVNIDYVTIGWNVPLRIKYLQGLRVSCSVNNLATITGYSGLTPRINSSVMNSSLGLDDKNILPLYRSYSMAISIKF